MKKKIIQASVLCAVIIGLITICVIKDHNDLKENRKKEISQEKENKVEETENNARIDLASYVKSVSEEERKAEEEKNKEDIDHIMKGIIENMPPTKENTKNGNYKEESTNDGYSVIRGDISGLINEKTDTGDVIMEQSETKEETPNSPVMDTENTKDYNADNSNVDDEIIKHSLNIDEGEN